MSGPFLVRHSRLPEQDGATGCVLSVWAVADLEAARRYASKIPYGLRPLRPGKGDDEQMAWLKAHDDLAYRLDGAGEFPLPDGSLVEVEATTWTRLMHDVPMSMFRHLGLSGADKQHICDRWNAEHGVGGEA